MHGRFVGTEKCGRNNEVAVRRGCTVTEPIFLSSNRLNKQDSKVLRMLMKKPIEDVQVNVLKARSACIPCFFKRCLMVASTSCSN